jgi:uncharacterized protein
VELTPEEGRVLGCLVEKQLTTPQHYPLTDKALITACNQTTSRDPVVDYDLTTVRVAVRGLRDKGLARTVHRSGERADKHQHELPAATDLGEAEVALLAVLLLRGPQTAAELRARTERMHPFGTADEVEHALGALVEQGLAVRLGRQPGRREERFAENVVGSGAAPAWSTGAVHEPPATSPSPPASEPVAAGGRPAVGEDRPVPVPVPDAVPDAEVAALAAEVAALRREVAALRDEVAALRG